MECDRDDMLHAAILPRPSIAGRMRRIALALSRRLEVVGLMNIQLAVLRPRSAMEAVYVIEVNPRASLTLPFVSKACMANIPAACRDRKYPIPGCSDGLYSA
ncbi:hypothetical protein [Candidatus Tremblaya princeps]|uniref:hypothetical protein n=1 Tax=Tremblaya princeps TaxID=189385 RepID=UPI000946621F|nr:hypothetical protein [Candidatus Tremblaya princeps]